MKLYRYDWDLVLRTYKVIKETPCGYWVEVDLYDHPSGKRWTSKHSRKRLAYPTKEEALDSFIARKRKQIEILEDQIHNAKHWYEQAKLLKTKGEEEYKKVWPYYSLNFFESTI